VLVWAGEGAQSRSRCSGVHRGRGHAPPRPPRRTVPMPPSHTSRPKRDGRVHCCAPHLGQRRRRRYGLARSSAGSPKIGPMREMGRELGQPFRVLVRAARRRATLSRFRGWDVGNAIGARRQSEDRLTVASLCRPGRTFQPAATYRRGWESGRRPGLVRSANVYPAGSSRSFGFVRGTPVLIPPRLPAPQWLVTVATGSFADPAAGVRGRSRRVRHRHAGRDPGLGYGTAR